MQQFIFEVQSKGVRHSKTNNSHGENLRHVADFHLAAQQANNQNQSENLRDLQIFTWQKKQIAIGAERANFRHVGKFHLAAQRAKNKTKVCARLIDGGRQKNLKIKNVKQKNQERQGPPLSIFLAKKNWQQFSPSYHCVLWKFYDNEKAKNARWCQEASPTLFAFLDTGPTSMWDLLLIYCQ